MIGLIAAILIDTSIVKIYDLVNKSFISTQNKVILFSANSTFCLISEFILIRHVASSFKRTKFDLWYKVSVISIYILGALIGYLIFQQFYYNYYDTSITIFIVIISYGIATGFIARLSLLFISWHKSNRSLIIFLYFVSMSFIALNLVTTALLTSLIINDRPSHVREFVGGSADYSVGKYVFVRNFYTISSVMSFVSIWATTAILVNYYRERSISTIIYWIILAMPLFYFLANVFYQFIITNMLNSYLTIDPITVSIILTAFLSLSKPIGGLIFAVGFWKISKAISYEKNIKTYMAISGWAIFLIFSADQALVQTQLQSPYPPFGLVTLTVLNIAAFLMLIGIYNSATHVSTNNELRRFIHKQALESRLLSLIGHAEMEKEILRTITKIAQDKTTLEEDTKEPIELDENELKKYIDVVVRESRKEHENPK
jgi:hypothetical protein